MMENTTVWIAPTHLEKKVNLSHMKMYAEIMIVVTS